MLYEHNLMERMVKIMKKFFNAEKWKTKNRNAFGVLNALTGWMFFVVACCATLLVCFYSLGNDNIAYGAETYPLKIEFCDSNEHVLEGKDIKDFCENMYYSADGGASWNEITQWQGKEINTRNNEIKIKFVNRCFISSKPIQCCAIDFNGNIIETYDTGKKLDKMAESSEEIIDVPYSEFSSSGDRAVFSCIRFFVDEGSDTVAAYSASATANGTIRKITINGIDDDLTEVHLLCYDYKGSDKYKSQLTSTNNSIDIDTSLIGSFHIYVKPKAGCDSCCCQLSYHNGMSGPKVFRDTVEPYLVNQDGKRIDFETSFGTEHWARHFQEMGDYKVTPNGNAGLGFQGYLLLYFADDYNFFNKGLSKREDSTLTLGGIRKDRIEFDHSGEGSEINLKDKCNIYIYGGNDAPDKPLDDNGSLIPGVVEVGEDGAGGFQDLYPVASGDGLKVGEPFKVYVLLKEAYSKGRYSCKDCSLVCDASEYAVGDQNYFSDASSWRYRDFKYDKVNNRALATYSCPRFISDHFITINDVVSNRCTVKLQGGKEYTLSDRANVSGENIDFEYEKGIYTAHLSGDMDNTNAKVTVELQRGYAFGNIIDDNGQKKVKINVEESITDVEDGNIVEKTVEVTRSYVLEDAGSTGNVRAHPVGRITIDISDTTKDLTFKFDNIVFEKYKLKFMDESGIYNDNDGFIKEDVAKIYTESSGTSNNKSIEVSYGTPYKLTIELGDKYNESDISVKLKTQSTGEPGEKTEIEKNIDLKKDTNTNSYVAENLIIIGNDEYEYYADKEFVEIYISNITVNRYNISLESESSISDVADIKMCSHESEDTELKFDSILLDQNKSYNAVNYCPYGNTLEFRIELKKWYKFNSDKEPLENLITNINDIKSKILVGEEITYKFDADERGEETGANSASVTVTIPGVINDLNINLKSTDKTIVGYDYGLRFIKGENSPDVTITTLQKISDGTYQKMNGNDSSFGTDHNFTARYGSYSYYLIDVGDGKIGDNNRVLSNATKEELEQKGIILQEIYLGTVKENRANDINVKTNLSKYRIIELTFNEKATPYSASKTEDIKLTNIDLPDKYVVVNYDKTQVKDLTAENFGNCSPFFKESIACTRGDQIKYYRGVEVGYNSVLEIKIEPQKGYSFDNSSSVKIYEIKENTEKDTAIGSIGNEDIGNTGENGVSYRREYNAGALIIKVENVRKSFYVDVVPDRDKVPIYFNATDGIRYYSTKEENGKYILENEIKETITVSQNESYMFAVGVNTGFYISSVKIEENGTGLEELKETDEEFKKISDDIKDSYKFYVIKNINESKNISSTVGRLECQLKFNKTAIDLDGNEISGTNVIKYLQDGKEISGGSVLYGDSFSFQVSLDERYNQSSIKVYVSDYENGEGAKEIIAYSGTYTINDIMGNKYIVVKNVSINQYTINFLPNDRAEYILEGNSAVSSGTKNVGYGETLTFKVKAKTGYKLDESTAINCVGYSGSESLLKSKVSGSSSESDVYECTVGSSNTGGIRENKTISVENVENIVYTLSFEKVEGVTYLNDTGAVISDSQKVKYGNNFEFSVNIDDAYDDSAAGMFIIVNGGKSSKTSAQKLASGRYIIPNITEDVTVKVGNIRKNRYTVTLTKTEGIDYYDENGKVITGDNEVEQNGTLQFKVSLYPAYEKSNITVMLGDKALPIDSSGFYLVSGVDENKTVTVIGIEKTKEAELINIIATLPDSVENLDDVNSVVEASRIYNSLSDEDKNKITNADILKKLQEQVKAFHHVSNDVRIDGVDWYLKLVVVPISSDTEVCGRIYKKLNSEYILSLYDVYLWDTLNDRKYSFTEDKTVTISVPAPDLTYFIRPTGIHENTNGKIDYLTLAFSNGRAIFETTSFSPMGIIANRSSTPGRSSLLDAVDANVDLIKDYALSNLGGNSSSKSNSLGTTVFNDTGSGNDLESGSDDTVEGNISEKYKSRNNRVTFQGSALRLILVLMIIVLISLALWIFYNQRRQRKKEK